MTKRTRNQKTGIFDQVRPSTVYGVALLFVIIGLLFPIIPAFLVPFVAIYIGYQLNKKGRLQDFTLIDFLLMLLYTAIGVTTLFAIQMISLNFIPWWKLLIVGIAADVVATFLGAWVGFGDIMSVIINLTIVFIVLDGPIALVIALLLGTISLFPGPSVGGNTLGLALMKVFSEMLGRAF